MLPVPIVREGEKPAAGVRGFPFGSVAFKIRLMFSFAVENIGKSIHEVVMFKSFSEIISRLELGDTNALNAEKFETPPESVTLKFIVQFPGFWKM